MKSSALQWIVGIAIIAAIAGGFLLFRDRLSGSATELAVGDCFYTPQSSDEVSDVQHAPCTEAHTAEVVFVGTMPDSETLPIGMQFDSYIADNCIPAFNSYTGLDFETAADYDINSLTPTRDGWAGGDREVTCFAVRVDGGTMTESLKTGS